MNQPNIEDFAENYIFKYLDRFNNKIDVWGDLIDNKIDKLIEKLGWVDGLPDPNSTADEGILQLFLKILRIHLPRIMFRG